MTIVSDYVLQIAYAFFSLLQELGFHFFLGILACAAVMAVKRKPFGRIAAIVCVALFPACNYKAPALAAGISFRQRHAPMVTIAFLVATLISPAGLAYIVGVFGWAFTITYVVVTAVVAAIILLLSSHLQLDKEDAVNEPTLRNDDEPVATAPSLSLPILFLKHTIPRVAAGLLLGSAVFSILSPALGQFVQVALARTPLLSAFDVIAVALSMHFCAPDDFALVALVAQSGLPIGAAGALMVLALLINLPEVFALAFIVGKKHLLAYLAAAVSTAAAFGAVVQLLSALGVVGSVSPINTGAFLAVVNHAAIVTPSFLALPCAIALLLLGLYGSYLMARPSEKRSLDADRHDEE